MPNVFGRDRLELTNTATLLYTCPERSADGAGTATDVVASAQDVNTQTQVTSFIVAHYESGAGSAHDYFIYYLDSSADAKDSTTIIYGGITLADGTTDTISPGIVMSPGNQIWAKSDAAGHITITINYIEIS